MGFSADWLAMREPADRQARDTTLLKRAAAVAGPQPVILDLGCGTGSTVRALAPHVGRGATWRLVDNDPDLLALAGAEAGEGSSVHCMDIAALDLLPLDGVTLVTASALFDLVTTQWLQDLAKRVRVPMYVALSYDGQMSWQPEHPSDRVVTEAFNRHQRGDKGLGAALGPDSVDTAEAILAEAGFDVVVAPSNWQLGLDQAPLHRALVAGIAQAAHDAGEAEAHAWGAARIAAADQTLCTIGHGDILALPRENATEAAHARR